jgi:hypothetical protein
MGATRRGGAASPSWHPDPWRGMARPLSLAGAQIHGDSWRMLWSASAGPCGSCLPRHGSRADQPLPASAVWIHGGATPTREGGDRRQCERGGWTRLSPSFAQHGGVGLDSLPCSVAAQIWLGGFDDGRHGVIQHGSGRSSTGAVDPTREQRWCMRESGGWRRAGVDRLNGIARFFYFFID